MLAGHLADVLTIVRQEYERHEIFDLLRDVSKVLGSRVHNNPSNYTNSILPLRDRAEQILRDDALRYISSADRKFLEDSSYGPFLPAALAQRVLGGLPPQQERAMSSGEFGIYVQGAQRTLGEINSVLHATSVLNIERYPKAPEEIELRIELPRSLFKDDLSEVADRFAYLDKLFAALTEAKTGQARKPRLVTVATSDLIAMVASNSAEIFAILAHYKAILEAVDTVLGIKKAYEKLKSLAQPTGIQEDHAVEALKNMVESVVEKTLNDPQMQADRGRKNELKKVVKSTSMQLAADLPKGLKISVSIESKGEFDYILSSQNITEEELTKQLERQRALQMKVDALARETEPLLVTADVGSANGVEEPPAASTS